MKVLITGATGFIGRHVLPLLVQNGWDIHAITSREMVDAPSGNVNWHQVDLFNADKTARLVKRLAATHLLHLAWYTEPGKYWTAPINLDWVIASLSLLLAFQKCGGKRAVMAGTCAEYDWNFGFCKEAVTPCVPASIYGQSKLHLYELCASYAAQINIGFAWGRVFYLYGPGELPQRLVPAIIRPLLVGEPAKCSHGLHMRDFLHVEDVAAAFVAMLQSEVSGAVNIGSGEPTQVKAVVSLLATLLGQSELVQFGAVQAAGSEPPLVLADNTRLIREVGWRPRYGLRDGLIATIKWWQEAEL